MTSTKTVPAHGSVSATIETLKTDQLSVDRTVQRGLNHRRVDEMVENFELEALGVLAVSHREDDQYHIVDGQHRWAAASKVGVPFLQCKVYEGLTRQQEAALFRVLNNTKIVNPIDKFTVRVVERDPAAVFIHDALERSGWHISTAYRGNGAFAAVAAIEWVYDGAGIKPNTRQQSAVRQVFEILTAAWGYDPDAVRADIVKGLGLFLVRFDGELDLAKIVKMLATFEGGPLRLTADGRLSRSLRHSTAADSVAEILTNLYNKKRTVNRLPEWFTNNRRPTADTVSDEDED